MKIRIITVKLIEHYCMKIDNENRIKVGDRMESCETLLYERSSRTMIFYIRYRRPARKLKIRVKRRQNQSKSDLENKDLCQTLLIAVKRLKVAANASSRWL